MRQRENNVSIEYNIFVHGKQWATNSPIRSFIFMRSAPYQLWLIDEN